MYCFTFKLSLIIKVIVTIIHDYHVPGESSKASLIMTICKPCIRISHIPCISYFKF